MLPLKLPALLLFALLFFQSSGSAQKIYSYESYPDDPLETRIYTLDNGLKVYMSPFDDQPRIQTYVAVKVGSKNDPAQTTGLAHYFEHLMFKGTSSFGTIDWEKEKPLLEEIEELFELYRMETDEKKRAALYEKIDSISYVASTYAIPNEYTRLMSAIGSTGTNAGTSNDYTYYLENIPANQLENWAKIQGIRFGDPVLRLFHTELETVYEEFNMSQTNDKRLVFQATNEALYPNHPYAWQTTLGEPEHLKNPSIKSIRHFYEQYYVPNNMAVVLAGDFDPDEAIKLVDQYFGHLKPSEVPEFQFAKEPALKGPVIKKVYGMESEHVQLAWRFEGASSSQIPCLEMVSNILGNGRAGLVDQNINMQQAARGTSATTSLMADYSMLKMFGRNKDGQSLEEVVNLLLEQVEVLKSGHWPQWMIQASLNNLRLIEAKQAESIGFRAKKLAMSFLQGIPYENTINWTEQLSTITKEEIVAFAREHLREDNFVIVYKYQVDDMEVEKVEKPAITPIHINRNVKSDLLVQVQNSEVPPIEPIFVDYEEELVRVFLPNGTEMIYVQDKSSPTFNLGIEWDMGKNHNLYLPYVNTYLSAVGTVEKSADQVSNEFYILAAGYSLRSSSDETRLGLRGLKENLVPAMELLQEVIWQPEINEQALKQQIANIKTGRRNALSSQQAIFGALENYVLYGPENPTTYNLSNDQLDQLNPKQMINLLHQLHGYEHRIVFSGPNNLQEVVALIQKYHKTPDALQPVPQGVRFNPLTISKEQVFFTHFEASQSYLKTVTKSQLFNPDLIPMVEMYNRYFSGGMNAIVFQELREKRGLAYMASSRYESPSRANEHYINTSVIATQNDKVVEAFTAFNELFDHMPLSQTAFRLAQEQNISNLCTERLRGGSLIISYLRNRQLGLQGDVRRNIFEQTSTITLEDLAHFNQQYLANQPKSYIIMGNENLIDFQAVENHFGEVIRLTPADLFAF